jgi:hypothetical protein
MNYKESPIIEVISEKAKKFILKKNRGRGRIYLKISFSIKSWRTYKGS